MMIITTHVCEFQPGLFVGFIRMLPHCGLRSSVGRSIRAGAVTKDRAAAQANADAMATHIRRSLGGQSI